MSATLIKNHRKIYSRLLFTITLCIVLTLLVSSLFYFFTYMRIDLKKAYHSDVSSLQQTSQEVISMTESAQSLSFQLYRNYTISKLMFYTDPSIYDVTAAINELDNYLNSMPFIESIYVYNSKSSLFYIATRNGKGTGGIVTKNELTDQGVLDILTNFQQYRPFTPIPRTYTFDNLTQNDQEIQTYTYLCYDAIGTGQTMDSAVIINISSAWINKDIAISHENTGGKSYILNDQGQLLSGDRLLPQKLSTVDGTFILEHIAQQESGYAVAQFEGKKSLVSYTSPDSLDWQYVRVTPYKEVLKTVYTIRNMTIIIAVSILIIGLFISWLLSHMLYRPIHQIVNKMNLLETEKRNSSYSVRQNMLRSIIHGNQPLQTNTQLQKLTQSGITFDFSNGYRVVLLKLDQFTQLKAERAQDLNTYKFAIMNISEEISVQHYRVETIDAEHDGVVLLLKRLAATEQPDDELLRSVLLQIQESVQQYLNLSLSIAYGPETTQIKQLSSHYKLVMEAAMHRLFYGLGCIIDTEQVMSLKSNEYIYPIDKERKMTDILMTGKVDEAKKLFVEIVNDSTDYPIHVLQLAISHLTMTINNVLYTIQKNHHLDIAAAVSIQIPTLEQFDTVDEINDLFFTLFDDIQAKLLMKRTMKQSDLIHKVNELIQQEYANPNLSLNWIADTLEMSSIYLSRIYKQQTLIAILEVINTVRLEKAEDFLKHSDLSIVDIALKSGYTSSSYFHRMFKKSFGITPAEYRKLKLVEQA